MKRQILLFAAATLTSTAAFSQTDAPAFPGAEGHGRYVTGGRGGEVRVVTNLNDSGKGSFREAVKGSAKKIVVFNVGGVIPLESELKIGANTTIAGQTAPSPGITLRYYTLRPGNNNIIRFIRVRRGGERDITDSADAIWTRGTTGVILDHCSFSWSIDEVASNYDNNNFTMQWCTVAEGLDTGHSKGEHSYGGIWGGKLASFHHNLIAHVLNRVPRFNGARYENDNIDFKDNLLYDEYKWENCVQAENVDFRNCVMYNWGDKNGCYGGPGGGQINIVNNYYKGGPITPDDKANMVTQISVASSSNSGDHSNMYDMTSRYFINGNTTETNKGEITRNRDYAGVTLDRGTVSIDGARWSKDENHFYDESVPRQDYNGESYIRINMDKPAPTGDITTHSAENALEKVLSYCGASLNRDVIDTRYMEEVRTGTAKCEGSTSGTQGILDLASDAIDYYDEISFTTSERAADFDTDDNGIADEWERANGLTVGTVDPNGYDIDTKGWYTNIEVYANSLVENIVKAQNADGESNYEEYYPECESTGIEDITAGASEVEKIEYYTLGGMKLSEPVKGINIRKITFTNGKTATDKVIK